MKVAKQAGTFFDTYADILVDPRDGGALTVDSESAKAADGHAYEPTEGIPSFFIPNDWDGRADITESMKAFYEETPFPNYDKHDSTASLINKAREGVFASALDDQIPYGARVIECGCGTGQLTNFLAASNRSCVGADMCLNSLKLAVNFRKQNNLHRAKFVQMNLFKPCFKPESFDVVISNGVLHHTSDCFGALKSITTLAKPGGYIIYGLYHHWGRLITDFRRWVFNASGDKFRFLDRRIVDDEMAKGKRDAWFMDQYKNPYETKHTIHESIGWLQQLGLEFVSSVPSTHSGTPFTRSTNLFEPRIPAGYFERLAVELSLIPHGADEGGFFIIVARKP